MPTFNVPTSAIPAAGDESAKLMERLFGQGWYDLQAGTGELAPLLYHMLGTINMVCLTFIGSYMIYITVVECMGTASEGKVGGKHDMQWTPLRMGYSIFMAAPVTKVGASIGQVVLLAAVGVSINVANAIWTEAVDFFSETGMTTIIADVPPTLRDEIDTASEVMYMAATLQAYGDRVYRSNSIDLVYKFIPDNAGRPVPGSEQKEGTGEKGVHVLTYTVPPGASLPASEFGSISLRGTRNDPVQKARIKGLQDAYSRIKVAGMKTADKVTPKLGFMKEARLAYQAAVAPELMKLGETYSEANVMKELKTFGEEAKQLGWIMAGTYTMKMARMQEAVNEAMFQTPIVVAPDYSSIVDSFADPYQVGIKDVVEMGDRALKKERLGNLDDPQKFDDSTTASGMMGKAWDILRGKVLFDGLTNKLSKNDPFLVLSNFGDNLISTASAIYGMGLAANMASGAASGAASSFWGKIVGAETATGAIGRGLQYTSPLLMLSSVGLFIVGAFFAYGLPALPFFYWTFAIAGWVLLVVEGLVAHPFWMVGHTISKQHGFAGEKGAQGYMLVLEILIRPPLIVFGLAFSYAAINGVGKTLGVLIKSFADSSFVGMFGLGGSAGVGLVTNLVLCFIACLIFWKVTHMYFTRGVAHLPRNVTKWVGGQGSMTQAEKEAEHASKTFIAGMQHANPGKMRGRPSGVGGGSKPGGGSGGGSGSGVEKSKLQDTNQGETQAPSSDKEL